MITEEEIDSLFEEVDVMLNATDEDLNGIVIFVKLDSVGHVYAIGTGKNKIIESMKVMAKELEAKEEVGRLN